MKQAIKKLLPTNRFARSVSILAGGTAAAQAITILAAPLLTRLYTPENFGILSIYASLLAIIAVIASLRYQLAIPIAMSDEDAANVVTLSLLVVIGMSILTAVFVGFFRHPIVEVLNCPSLAVYLWLLPIGLFLVGTYQVFQYWAIRTKAFPAIARTKLAQALSMVGMQIGGHTFGALALLIAQIFGQMAGITSLIVLAARKHWNVFKKVRAASIVLAAGRYRRFPLYSTWGAVFNTAGSHLPPLLFAGLFSVSSAGFYLLAHRVLAIPSRFIGMSVADVFFSSAVDAHRQDRLRPLVARIHEKLAHFIMPPVVIIVLAGPDLFSLMFGTEWRLAGEFSRWMAVYIYFQFVSSPLSQLFSVLEKQAQGTFYQGCLLITQIGGLSIGALYGSSILSVALFSLGSAICYFGLLIWMISVTKNDWSVLWSPTIKALAWSILLVSPFMIFHILSENVLFWFLALCFSSALIGCRYFLIAKKSW